MECFTTIYPSGKVFHELCTFDYTVYRVVKLPSKDNLVSLCNDVCKLLIHKDWHPKFDKRTSRKQIGRWLHTFISHQLGLSSCESSFCFRLHFNWLNDSYTEYKLDCIEPYFINNIKIVISNG